jgi:hypothetical protein
VPFERRAVIVCRVFGKTRRSPTSSTAGTAALPSTAMGSRTMSELDWRGGVEFSFEIVTQVPGDTLS